MSASHPPVRTAVTPAGFAGLPALLAELAAQAAEWETASAGLTEAEPDDMETVENDALSTAYGEAAAFLRQVLARHGGPAPEPAGDDINTATAAVVLWVGNDGRRAGDLRWWAGKDAAAHAAGYPLMREQVTAALRRNRQPAPGDEVDWQAVGDFLLNA